MNRGTAQTNGLAVEWIKRLDGPMAEAAREVRLLGSVTPIDAHRERARVVLAFERGEESAPRWEYAKVDRSALMSSLARAEAELLRITRLESKGAFVRVLEVYEARLRELDLERRVAVAAGDDTIASVARERFANGDRGVRTRASALSAEWLEAHAREAREPTAPPTPAREAKSLKSDAGDDPRSLLSRMRQEVGRRRLPFNVVAHAALAPLAATGERTIFVAADRDVTDADVERTILHELDGHAMPRVRAASQALGIFAFGTARGADDQEGYALVLEDRGGHLRGARRAELGARHQAVNAMHEGASFVDVVRLLMRRWHRSPRAAVLAAERAYRGGDGVTAGLGRDRIYLEAFLRVGAHLDAHPRDESVLKSGAVSVDAIDALREYVTTQPE
jgi:hypothetical protein